MAMKGRSKTTGMRVGLLLALLIGMLGSHWEDILPAAEPDPDEIHVLRQGGKFGKLSLEVKEAGSHLHMPARLYFTYDDGREELPVVGRFQHFLVTASGRDLKTLPVGEYQVYVSRGTEYSLDRQKVKIEEGRTTYLSSTLERVVDTAGFISADFHLQDWYRLLNRGVLMAGVANTDAHRYPQDSLGYPRNYVASDTDNPWEIDPRKVVQAVKRRAVTGSLGPFLHFTGNGSPVGSVITDPDRSVSLRIQLQSAPWVPVETLEVIRNGEVIRTWSVPPPEEREKPWKFDTELVVDCARDSWYLVIASSRTPWEKPFENYRSFSFTNPVFVDVDGNGYFDPPNGGFPLQDAAD